MTSGLWGDTGSDPGGMHLGCIPNRHFALLVTLHNRMKASITLTGVKGDEPAPGIIRRVAVQARLAPPPPRGDVFVPALRGWSDASLVPVTVPPGREASVQSNFVMNDCGALRPYATLTVNHAIDVSYRAHGQPGVERITQRSARILLSSGPTIRECTPAHGDVAGAQSVKLRTLNLACRVGRRVSVVCRRITHGLSGSSCRVGGVPWGCNWIQRPRAHSVESCFVHTSSLRAVWVP